MVAQWIGIDLHLGEVIDKDRYQPRVFELLIVVDLFESVVIPSIFRVLIGKQVLVLNGCGSISFHPSYRGEVDTIVASLHFKSGVVDLGGCTPFEVRFAVGVVAIEVMPGDGKGGECITKGD